MDKDYVIFWERSANSGVIYCSAKNPEEAVEKHGWDPEYVLHTVVEQASDPIRIGKRG